MKTIASWLILSTMPGIGIYARKVAALNSSAPECQELGT
jgi:hypothetical protein